MLLWGWYNEAEQIFEAILSRTPNDINSKLNYGTMIADSIIKAHDSGQGIKKSQLEKARNLIFQALDYDKKAHKDRWLKTAYKNLCFLRAIEAVYYYYKKELFTAFVLGWVSFEMSLYRIWFKFINTKTTEGKDELLRWNAEYVIETLLLCGVDSFRSLKDNLDILKGIRNKLLHGELNSPTRGNTLLCINTALKLVGILQD